MRPQNSDVLYVGELIVLKVVLHRSAQWPRMSASKRNIAVMESVIQEHRQMRIRETSICLAIHTRQVHGILDDDLE